MSLNVFVFLLLKKLYQKLNLNFLIWNKRKNYIFLSIPKKENLFIFYSLSSKEKQRRKLKKVFLFHWSGNVYKSFLGFNPSKDFNLLNSQSNTSLILSDIPSKDFI